MATRADLISRVLKNLSVWQAGQDLPPEDYRVVDEDLEKHLAAMAASDIIVVEDPNQIPDQSMTEIANYLANEFATVFGLAGDELAEIKERAAFAERALRYQRVMPTTYAVLQADYF